MDSSWLRLAIKPSEIKHIDKIQSLVDSKLKFLWLHIHSSNILMDNKHLPLNLLLSRPISCISALIQLQLDHESGTVLKYLETAPEMCVMHGHSIGNEQ